MTVYIPCYFNNIKDRINNFYKIIIQYLNLDYFVIIYWMNDFDISLQHEKLKIIKGEQVNASIARNKLLDVFYKSNENYSIFSDDDTYITTNIESQFDLLSLTNDYDKNLKETSHISSSFMIIKNFNKFYNIKPFFDENLEANQDLDFGINLNSLNIKTYRKSDNRVIIYKGKSSMFNNNMNKLNKKQESLNYINKKWQIL